MFFKALGEPSGNRPAAVSSRPGVRQRFDCQACGACCLNTQRNRDLGTREYVEVTAGDALFARADLHAALTVRNAEGRLHLRMVGDDERCASLDGDVGEGVGCEIYALRPSGCREVEAGDDECLRARRMHGLPLTESPAT